MPVVKHQRAALFLGIALSAIAICYIFIHSGSFSNAEEPMKHHWTIEAIDSTDRTALKSWAREMCRDLDIDAAAEGLNVEPTADAVVNALTDFLPRDIQDEVANVCFEELRSRSE